MSRQVKVSLIIPAYNEAKKITKDILEASRFFKSQKITSEIIVSADGCTDNTAKIVKDLQKNTPNLILLYNNHKNGKGGAIKRGIEIATGKYIIFADAGYCIPFRYILPGISKLEKGFDCALASRASRQSKITIKQPIYRQLGSKIFGLIVRNLVGIPKNIKDTQCGFKIFKKPVAKILFDQLITTGFMFDIEIILRAKKNHYKLSSFPVEWKNDNDTRFNPVFGSLDNFKDLLKIKLLYRL